MTDVFTRADEIFAGMTVAALPKRQDGLVGVAEILRYLTDPNFDLSVAQITRMQRTAELRDTYDAFMCDLSVSSIPVLAAAADDDEASLDLQPIFRVFEGGRLSLRPSPHPGVFYLRLEWDQGRPPSPSLVLHLTLDGVPVGRLALPPPDPDGTINELLNAKVLAQNAVIQALRAPRSQGHILPQAVEEGLGDDYAQ